MKLRTKPGLATCQAGTLPAVLSLGPEEGAPLPPQLGGNASTENIIGSELHWWERHSAEDIWDLTRLSLGSVTVLLGDLRSLGVLL